MENTSQPNPPDAPSAADLLALVQRVGVLERRMEGQGTDSGAAPRGRRQHSDLSAELERHRDQLRDHEKALVERIADVDDDRRATASRLQRAWQTQREEIDDRLRRHAGVVAGLMLLFVLAVCIALFLLYRQATTEQRQIAEEVGQMREELDRIAGDLGPDHQVRSELERLGAQVEGMASSLKQSDQGDRSVDRGTVAAAGRAARDQGGARISKEIRRLDTERTRLAEELEGLRSALEATRAAQAAPAAPAAAVPLELPPASLIDVRAEDAGPSADKPAPNEPTPDEPTGQAGPDGGDESASPAAPDATAQSSEQVGESPASADEDADALGSDETIIAGDESYALQLIGFFDRDSLAAFVAHKGLPPRVFYIRQTYKGRPWYAMVHSLHKGYVSAAEALAGLPRGLVALNPWIRPVPPGTELRVLQSGPRQGAGSD